MLARGRHKTGRTRSRTGERSSATRPTLPSRELELLLGRIYDDARRGEKKSKPESVYRKNRADFVFHMTDWLADFKDLGRLFRHPEKADPKNATLTLMGILYHVIPHLKAAGRLLLDDVPDAFEQADSPGNRNGKQQ